MDNAGNGREVEVKLRIPSARAGHELIRKAGIPIARPRVFESNTVYDTPDGALRGRGELIRLRTAGARAVLTYKGAGEPGKHKSREELETVVGDAGVAALILSRLGLVPVFRYEKYRTEFKAPGSPGVVTLDETPIGVFLELEGTPEWIDSEAARLGFAEKDYITASYGSLYLESCRSLGITPSHMVFAPAST